MFLLNRKGIHIQVFGLSKADIYDDKANYVYGRKQLFYLQSIESKSHVAIFRYGNRNDDRTDNGMEWDSK